MLKNLYVCVGGGGSENVVKNPGIFHQPDQGVIHRAKQKLNWKLIPLRPSSKRWHSHRHVMRYMCTRFLGGRDFSPSKKGALGRRGGELQRHSSTAVSLARKVVPVFYPRDISSLRCVDWYGDWGGHGVHQISPCVSVQGFVESLTHLGWCLIVISSFFPCRRLLFIDPSSSQSHFLLTCWRREEG